MEGNLEMVASYQLCRLSFVVGNRQRVKFWNDTWCGEAPLSVFILALFAIVMSKEAWV